MADAKNDFSRVCELEADLVRVQTSLLVIASSIEALADRYATAKAREQGITEDDVNILYGASYLVEQVAAECYRAFKGNE